MIDPTGVTTYTYDALNRLTSVTNNRGFTTSFTYDALGRRTSMTHGNGVQTTYSYDAASQLTRLAHQLGAATVNSFDYSYDRVGNRTSKTTTDGAHSYTYDTLNRLIKAMNPLPSNPLETYSYDAVGNRSGSNQSGSSIFNGANQLLEDANFTHQYDNNGNLTRKTSKTPGPFTSYEYDAENKLVRVVNNGTTASYKYDGLGRRVEKEVNDGATTKVTRFIYDRQSVLLELDGSNNIVSRYTHGPAIDEPLILERSGDSFFYHADALGSITEITDAVGNVVKSYTYSSFGKIETETNPTFVQPYTFTGREFDPETGLYYYRARYYDPATGRFIQQDPRAGYMSLPQSLNKYPYVANRPIILTDPTGELWQIVATIVVAAGVAWYICDVITSLSDIIKAVVELDNYAQQVKASEDIVMTYPRPPGYTQAGQTLERIHSESAISKATVRALERTAATIAQTESGPPKTVLDVVTNLIFGAAIEAVPKPSESIPGLPRK